MCCFRYDEQRSSLHAEGLIGNAVESLDNKKASGEDGITGEIYKQTSETFHKFITAMYNGCLRSRVFPKRWKRTKLMPIIKSGKKITNIYRNFAQ
jgi:hypothetical protein